ncbi:MAG: hypothetical protein KAU38_00100 [Desulfobacterales bacterium]|nr:hypothetical protein [Desulfobacterales bacterium]
MAVFYGFFIHGVPSKSLPRQIDSTLAVKANLKEYKKITGKEERPKIPGGHL